MGLAPLQHDPGGLIRPLGSVLNLNELTNEGRGLDRLYLLLAAVPSSAAHPFKSLHSDQVHRHVQHHYYNRDSFSALCTMVSWTTLMPPLWLVWLFISQSPSPAVQVGGCWREVGRIICSSLTVFHWVSPGMDNGWRNFLRLEYPPPGSPSDSWYAG